MPIFRFTLRCARPSPRLGAGFLVTNDHEFYKVHPSGGGPAHRVCTHPWDHPRCACRAGWTNYPQGVRILNLVYIHVERYSNYKLDFFRSFLPVIAVRCLFHNKKCTDTCRKVFKLQARLIVCSFFFTCNCCKVSIKQKMYRYTCAKIVSVKLYYATIYPKWRGGGVGRQLASRGCVTKVAASRGSPHPCVYTQQEHSLSTLYCIIYHYSLYC